MAKTGKEHAEEIRQRRAEYNRMRNIMLAIIDDDKAEHRDKIGAMNAIYRLDKEGVPMPKAW